MKHPFVCAALRGSAISVCLFALTACNDVASTVRKVTYPPDFKYVTEAELRSNMQRLAYNLEALDQALASAESEPAERQRRAVDALTNIARVATDLRAGDAGSNHPFLQDYMGTFASQVGRARIAASLNPPDYYPAGKVAGACTSCHRVNRD